MYVDCHLAAGVLTDAARRTTIHTTDYHAGTGGLGAEVAGADLTAQCTLFAQDNGCSKAAVFL